MALAAARDGPQVRPHLLHRPRPDGPLPRVPLRRLPGPAPGLDARPLPGPLGADEGADRRGAARAHRQHVGGGRLQHPLGRVAGPPDRPRQALLPRRVRDRDQRRLAARRVRLLGRPAPDHAAGRHPLVPHPEAVLEPVQRPAPPQLLLGGHRRLAGLHPLPAGGHLRRQRQRARAALRRRELQGPRPGLTVALPLRLGGRGRWPDRRDARVGPAAGRHRRGAAAQHGGTPGVLQPAEAEAEIGRRRRSGSGELYLELHRGTYTSQAATKLGNRRGEFALREAELWAALATGSDYPARRPRRAVEVLLLAPVPRHHSRARASTGSTRTPPATTPRSSPRRTSWPSGALGRAGRCRRHLGHRPPGGGLQLPLPRPPRAGRRRGPRERSRAAIDPRGRTGPVQRDAEGRALFEADGARLAASPSTTSVPGEPVRPRPGDRRAPHPRERAPPGRPRRPWLVVLGVRQGRRARGAGRRADGRTSSSSTPTTPTSTTPGTSTGSRFDQVEDLDAVDVDRGGRGRAAPGRPAGDPPLRRLDASPR